MIVFEDSGNVLCMVTSVIFDTPMLYRCKCKQTP